MIMEEEIEQAQSMIETAHLQSKTCYYSELQKTQ